MRIGERRQPEDGPALGRVGGGLGDEQTAHAGIVRGALARRIDVCHDDHVRSRQRASQLAREQPRARIQVRLEHRYQPVAVQRARRRQRRRDLARMVRVVVVHERSARRAPDELQAATRAGEARERARSR